MAINLKEEEQSQNVHMKEKTSKTKEEKYKSIRIEKRMVCV